MKTTSIKLFATALLVSAPAFGSVINTTTFHLDFCGSGDPGSSCYVAPSNGNAPLSAYSGIDGALQSFYGQIGGDFFGYGTSGSGGSYIYGTAQFSDFPQAYFVYDYSIQQVVCCTADAPYSIIGANSGGAFIGRGEAFSFIYDGVPGSTEIGNSPIHLDMFSLSSLSSFYGPDIGDIGNGDIFWFDNNNSFLSIDDNYNIEGNSQFGFFRMTPVIDQISGEVMNGVPEPSSIVTLITMGLIFLGIGTISRKRSYIG
jgi:hypothetical protein